MSTDFHRWDLQPKEAISVQKVLASRVIKKKFFGKVSTIAGVDVSIKSGTARAAVVVLNYPGLEKVDQSVAELPVAYPYIPGLLSFREGPVVIKAIENLSKTPDVFIFDGQGIAHPRRLGLASHIGVILDIPTIGCAKSCLCGQYDEVPGRRGSHVPLVHKEKTIGAVLRTRSNVKPVFVSIGHRVDLKSCIELVFSCCTKYRLPETTRQAHNTAGNRL